MVVFVHTVVVIGYNVVVMVTMLLSLYREGVCKIHYLMLCLLYIKSVSLLFHGVSLVSSPSFIATLRLFQFDNRK